MRSGPRHVGSFHLAAAVLALVLAGAGCGSSDGETAAGASHHDAGTDGGALPNVDAGVFVTQGGDDPDIAYSVTMVSDEFDIAPNTEVYKCQDFANPFKGATVDVVKHESHMPEGSHHLLFFMKTGATDGHVEDCSGFESFPFQYVAQSPDFSMEYPKGVGATMPPSFGFRMNMHYLNTGSKTIHAQDRVTMYVAKSGVVTQHAGTIFYQQVSINVPTGSQPYTSTRTCNVPQDVNLLSADSHMHKRATEFTATADGMPLYHTTLWADPLLTVYSPPIHLASGTPITWSCTYVNDTSNPLTFGESAQTNVMCIYQGSFYPVADVNDPILHCEM